MNDNMKTNDLKKQVKRSLFQKEHFTEAKKEKMLENILIQHYSGRPRRKSMVLEWVGIVACLLLLVTTTFQLTGTEMWFPTSNNSAEEALDSPYISAAYMKRSTEIAKRDTDILDVTYFAKGTTLHLELMVPETLSEAKMKEAANTYLTLLSHLYIEEYNGLGDLWRYYSVDIIITAENEYVIQNYFDENQDAILLKGTKAREDTSINWNSTN
ncbi:hypothetical protein [Guptibacillus algicola]|uniref:hypothetical protein n=1 Tax=Guptibacillus algicola TaxID=225844 RepID=UPI001CD2C76C|nr:hypothetical protein [Alkalihalobacillus algicola]MCA0989090.1 hypothetical protein [Alkalihalobacillus algicola]